MSDPLVEYLDSIERDDRYVVDEVLKEGTFETTQRVYLSDIPDENREFYVRKYIDKETGLGTVYERIFKAQQQGVNFLYLPKIIDYYEIDGQRVVIMEYIDGETLSDAVYNREPSLSFAQEVFVKLCDAVSELHEKFDPPIIHRDLKPSNIILSGSRLTIIDFGIARTFKVDSETDTLHFGTRTYAPPEQFGFGQTDVRSDVYALGMLLYFCLTEQNPDQNARNQNFFVEGVSKPLSEVIACAAELDPANRYGSAAELKKAFIKACDETEALQATHPISSTDSSDATSETFNRKLVTDTFAESGQGVKTQHPGRLPKTKVGRAFARIPFPIGVIWDLVLAFFFVIFLVVCLVFIFNPDTVRYPALVWSTLGERVLLYGGTYLVIIACLYAVCDRRLLIQIIPRLADVSIWEELLVCLIVFVVGCIGIGVSNSF